MLSKTELKINPAENKHLKIMWTVCNLGTLHVKYAYIAEYTMIPNTWHTRWSRGPNELFFHAADQGKTWRLWTWRLLPVSIGQLEASSLKLDESKHDSSPTPLYGVTKSYIYIYTLPKTNMEGPKMMSLGKGNSL